MNIVDFIRIVLRGVSQVFFQNNVLTGLLLLIGIFYSYWLIGIGVLIGVLAGTLTALIFKYNREEISDGLYGFNGALVGAVIFSLFEFSFLLIWFVIFGSILSSIIANFLRKKKIAAYNLPFVLSTWLLIIFVKIFDLLILKISASVMTNNLDLISSLSLGLGQVMYVDSVITGVIFFIAIWINSKRSAIYGLLGSLLGMLFALVFLFQLNLINLGIFGFNAVLCGIVFGNEKDSSFFYVILSVFLSVLILQSMIYFNFVALASPFVFAVWVVRKKKIFCGV